jgi:predicted RNase H-like HicB family nuclease
MPERAVNYPVAIHKDEHSDYGMIVPDLHGCFSAGETIEEAVSMANETSAIFGNNLMNRWKVNRFCNNIVHTCFTTHISRFLNNISSERNNWYV